MRRDRCEGFGIIGAQKFQRAVGEHNAEAERGIGGVLLDHADVGVRPAAFQQISEIKPGRSGTEDGDAHGTI
jgi:hypothetical protein